jgi:hypothetical protein
MLLCGAALVVRSIRHLKEKGSILDLSLKHVLLTVTIWGYHGPFRLLYECVQKWPSSKRFTFSHSNVSLITCCCIYLSLCKYIHWCIWCLLMMMMMMKCWWKLTKVIYYVIVCSIYVTALTICFLNYSKMYCLFERNLWGQLHGRTSRSVRHRPIGRRFDSCPKSEWCFVNHFALFPLEFVWPI